MSDLSELFAAEEKSRRWRAEMENASARYELAKIEERCAYLISRHDPIASTDLDRKELKLVFSYLRHDNVARLQRELQELRKEKGEPNGLNKL